MKLEIKFESARKLLVKFPEAVKTEIEGSLKEIEEQCAEVNELLSEETPTDFYPTIKPILEAIFSVITKSEGKLSSLNSIEQGKLRNIIQFIKPEIIKLAEQINLQSVVANTPGEQEETERLAWQRMHYIVNKDCFVRITM